MIHSIIAYVKGEAVAIAVLAAVVSGIGLMANDVTAPKVLAIMVFLSDWNMLWTWEWWTRMMILLALSTAVWFYQKRKDEKKFAHAKSGLQGQIVSLQGEVRHLEALLATARVTIAVLERK